MRRSRRPSPCARPAAAGPSPSVLLLAAAGQALALPAAAGLLGTAAAAPLLTRADTAGSALVDAVLLLPVGLVAAWAGAAVTAGAARSVWAAVSAALFCLLATPLHVGVQALGGTGAPGVPLAARLALALLGTALAALLLLASAERALVVLRSRPRVRRRVQAASLALTVLTPVGVVGAAVPGQAAVPAGPPATVPATCDASSEPDRSYDVVAIDVAIPFNRWGARLESGQVFVLRSDEQAVRHWSTPLATGLLLDPAKGRRLRPRPLVLRANEGECVQVRLTNALSPTGHSGLPDGQHVSLQVSGVAYDAQTSAGSATGYSPDTTVPPGGSRTYWWSAPQREGLYGFRDAGTPAGAEHDAGGTGFGLFGALAVEPAGSLWKDPESGAMLYDSTNAATRGPWTGGTTTQSGSLYVEADILPPGRPAFRETVQLSWDEIPGIGMGFNYGSEPLQAREAQRCGDCLGEETWLSSWPYGDPSLVKLASGPGPWLPERDLLTGRSTSAEDCGLPVSCWVSNVVHAYQGDPTKIRYGHSGTKETHVFHVHAHQWQVEPDAAPGSSSVVDSQTYGPGEMFTADLLHGAGSRHGTFGDSIFHCHLYPHFAEGFWALLRVHDVREDGTGSTPDGVRVRPLQPLPEGPSPARPTAMSPGFPRMVPGVSGWRAPQPPGSVTTGGPSGPAAPRLVAGRPLDPAALAVEKAVTSSNGGRPGAPFRDPCPTGARTVRYAVTVLQRDLVYNEAGEHDPQGRLFVLDEHVAEVLAGTREPEPLFFRVNAGDCIDFTLTNMLPNWVGADAFLTLTQTNMVGQHIHLVEYDVTASDGASNGWNYQQAAFSRTQADFDEDVLAGRRSCTPASCRVPDPASWDPAGTTSDPATMRGQTLHERWYADSELRTVFTHDHHFAAVDQNRGLYGALLVEPTGFDTRHPVTGDYLQPVNDPAHGPVCATSCTGGAVGALMDMVGPGPHDDFREYGLALADFVPLVKRGGDPRDPDDVVNPPSYPEKYPDDDPGTMAVNYRNAPLRLRQHKGGHQVDPAHQFSSFLLGDPLTPLLQAYGGDDVRFRLVQGSQEEQHVFMVNGLRWRKDPSDPRSPLTNTHSIGVSEAFTMSVPLVDCATNRNPQQASCVGDYLWSGAATTDTWLGMWGLLRVHGQGMDHLKPLPDNPVGRALNPSARNVPTGTVPLAGSAPGDPCPTDAPRRRFDVVAMAARTTYDRAGDHDPHGLLYALASDQAALASGAKQPEPLTLRVNEGDCVEVTLTNRLPSSWLEGHRPGTDGDPALPTEPSSGTPGGLRVSMNPQLLRYDVRGSDGTAVGYNMDQTVRPGGSRTYRWYADDPTPRTPGDELGASNLLDFGDLRGHRHHGLFGGLVVLPRGSVARDPLTGATPAVGAAADVRAPGRSFRDAVTYLQDGLNLRDASGAPVVEPQHDPHAVSDSEDEGEKALSYRAAPFGRRLGGGYHATHASGEEWAHVMSSRRHGDPETPLLRAYSGDALRLRVLQGGDRPRQHAFALAGHRWLSDPLDPRSNLVSVQGGHSVGRTLDVVTRAGSPGDHRYGCMVAAGHLSGGMWGLLRVYPAPPRGAVHTPTALAPVDDPLAAGNAPLQPLDTVELTARVVRDADLDGAAGGDEAPVPGVPVTLLDGSTELVTRTTGSDGTVLFHAAPGAYRVRADSAPGWVATSTPALVSATPEAPHASVSLTVAALTATPPGGSYAGAQSVALSSEPGAVLRYTLDGSAPSARSGAVYTGPITVGVDRRLRVALVLGGGHSPDVTHAYRIGRDRRSGQEQAPSSWTTTTGSTTGPPSVLAVAGEPSGTMTVTAAPSRGALRAAGWGALTLPGEAPTALSVSWAGGTDGGDGTREVALWDWSRRSWETVSTGPQPAAGARHVVDVSGEVRRFVSPTGQVHVRLEGAASRSEGAWALVADQLAVRPTWG